MQTQTRYVTARQMPHNAEVEQALLGAIMTEPEIILEITTKPQEFFIESHAVVFEAMLELSRGGHEINAVTLGAQIAGIGKSDIVKPYLYTDLLSATPSAIGYRKYADIIRKLHTQRLIIAASGKIAEIGYAETDKSDEELLSAVHAVASSIESGNVSLDGVTLSDAVYDSLPEITDYLDGNRTTWGVPTGLRDLDAYIGGLAYGEMTLVAADPGKGKTMLVTTIALNAARAGYAGLFFSLEMTLRQLMLRLYAQCGSVSTGDIRRGKLTQKQRDEMFYKVQSVKDSNLTIFDEPIDTDTLERAILRQQRRGKVNFAVVDYSDLLKDSAESEVVRMKHVSHALKNIAKRTGIALLVVHPISREAEDDSVPKLRNLGWGRAWEYDAHTVLFPHFKKDRKDFSAVIGIGKYRDGEPNNKIECVFDGRGWYDIAR